MIRSMFVSATVLLAVGAATAQEPKSKKNAGYPPSFPEAKAEVYKTVGDSI